MGVQINGVAQGNLAFPATQIASGDANTLDDYEEGTWVPQLADTSGDGSGECQTYGVQVGRYVKIGSRVYIQGTLTMTSTGNLATCDACNIKGLPFTSNNTTNNSGTITFGRCTGLAVTAGFSVVGLIQANEARMFPRLWDATTGNTAVIISEVSADGDFEFSGHYEV